MSTDGSGRGEGDGKGSGDVFSDRISSAASSAVYLPLSSEADLPPPPQAASRNTRQRVIAVSLFIIVMPLYCSQAAYGVSNYLPFADGQLFGEFLRVEIEL
jgi:hypothetical protein